MTLQGPAQSIQVTQHRFGLEQVGVLGCAVLGLLNCFMFCLKIRKFDVVLMFGLVFEKAFWGICVTFFLAS